MGEWVVKKKMGLDGRGGRGNVRKTNMNFYLLQFLGKSVKEAADLFNIGNIGLSFGLLLSNRASDRVWNFVQKREHNLISLAVTDAHQVINILKLMVLENGTNGSSLINSGGSKLQSLVTKDNLRRNSK